MLSIGIFIFNVVLRVNFGAWAGYIARIQDDDDIYIFKNWVRTAKKKVPLQRSSC
jgi:hypothetical protein